jgi:predicted CXXCH cytochrome family protein
MSAASRPVPGTLRKCLVAGYLLLNACLAFSAAPAQQAHPDWAGAATCKGCHQQAFDAWQDSHHDLAMQPATVDTVLGDFTGASFQYAGKTSRFFRRDGGFWVNTEGPDGKLADFQVSYVFGVDPLQQYLVAFPGGRLQALGIAWDVRPAEAGGQRWFHLYPDEEVVAGDPLHWTGPYQNWNLQCAECHSTRLRKNYNPQSKSYGTTWSEIDVSCEACHGPGVKHVALARSGELAAAANGGFPMSLAERGGWAWPEGEANARRLMPLPHSQQVETCGRCHARRGSLGEYRFGEDLSDTHRPALLRDPLYHADGQILDEVYVYGSFLQSKMYAAGVVCSNCHEPHSNALRAPGDGVCAQCHKPAVYAAESHHHHPQESAGAACVNCHMPASTYMVVDPRRDHSMRVPRPDLSAAVGTPNACNLCHSDRDPQWAMAQLREWGVRFTDTSTHPARSIALARRGDGRAVPGLAQIANNANMPGIWRATAMAELANFGSRESFDTANRLLQSEDALERWSAVRAMVVLPLPQRYARLAPMIEDENTTVRLEVARLLAEIPLEALEPQEAARLQRIFDEYLATMGRHADVPESQLEMGLFFVARRLWVPAERAYQNAIDMNPQLLIAYLNKADLYRLTEREDAGREVLLQAAGVAPGEGTVWHALGLLEIRVGNNEKGMEYLRKAAELETQGVRHRYVYGVALHDSGEEAEAIAVLQSLLREAPANPDLLLALATYSRGAGNIEEARRYGRQLIELMPDDPSVRQFYKSL